MKNYKVIAIRYFKDKHEKQDRFINDEFFCTKERYEFLKENNAVKLVEIVEEEKEITEEEVQAVANAIVEEEKEEPTDEVVEEIISKKKKTSKK